ncbi:hypothetical protein SCP_0602370 [Sparassis crispa]|uniref:Uncharacterized protein n=1 Tax=Sparassis crispa TaxID=139825 RepID=A0A401GQ35_9APHY|nr:hypothetical protein SCP_0602370 [Sparassis crispa]GBE84259.1 hypothetical protein SCP_0602370 [Sparassis crispa]
MSARVAETSLTELTNVILQRKLAPLTPLWADAWEELLSISGLTSHYPRLVSSIRFGFDVGIL